jgi:hypothetical protein
MDRIACAALLMLACATSTAQINWQARVSTELLNVYTQAQSGRVTQGIKNAPNARFDSGGRVQVDVHIDCSTNAPTQELAAAGLKITALVKVSPFCVVEGWIAPASLPGIAALAGIVKVEVPKYAIRKRPLAPQSGGKASSGAPLTQAITNGGGSVIDGNAIAIMHADQFLSATGVNGQGVTVGVMSDDVTSLSVIQGRGELPNVTVVASSAPFSQATDEGTMMLEEVHAVAPGAALAFCGPATTVAYVGCLQGLMSAGATVLVDDLTFAGDDMMSASDDFESAVQTVLSQSASVMLFTVSGNMNGSYWQGSYQPVSVASLGASPFTCGAQTDSYVESFGGVGDNAITAYASSDAPYLGLIEWADPFDQNASNFDIYLVNTSNNTATCMNAAGNSATELALSVPAGSYALVVATPDQTLSGKFLKFLLAGDGATTLALSSSGSVFSPQAFVPGVVVTGATNASDGIGNTIEPYSGTGPLNLIFPSPEAVQAPQVVGLDAVYVDAAGTDFQTQGGLFYGTSAAAPNAAAVAALIRAAYPTLTPAEVTTTLETGATQLGATVPDGTFGYGRVDAMGALGAVPGPSISGFVGATIVGGSSSPVTNLTVSGTGNLKLTVQSSNPALIPATLVAQGTPGVTIAPASCGAPTTSCTISVTPVVGQLGTAEIILMATDGANRSASSANMMTVNNPPVPTVTVTAGGSQTITEGGALTPVSFSVAGFGSLTVTANSTNPALLPTSAIALTGGCGGSTKSCKATLSAMSGQAGTSTITLSATDAYGQVGVASASLQVNDPPAHSGGGGMDPEALLLLAGLLARRVSGRLRPAQAEQ